MVSSNIYVKKWRVLLSNRVGRWYKIVQELPEKQENKVSDIWCRKKREGTPDS